MSEFCNHCNHEMYGNDFEPDINIPIIIESLEPDTYMPVLCEGCGMRAIGKNIDGAVYIAMPAEEEDMPIGGWIDPVQTYVRWYTLEEYTETFTNK